MVTATNNRTSPRVLAAAAIAVAAVSVAVAGCQSSAPATGHGDGDGKSTAPAVPPVHVLPAKPAPAAWHEASLSDGGAVLAYPPDMHPVSGDRGTVSVAQLSAPGNYLMYLNATPKQGAETLSNWPEFRLEHLTDDDASTARQLAASDGVRFLGGTGTCVIDAYITKDNAHHFTEIACFVQGKTSSSVIIAAAPTASWATASGLLMRAVAAYQVR
jgi:hypothetical protein